MIRTQRIVIVEDEPDTLLMLRLNLEATGYETSLAADGATAVHRITEEQPDLVLLDLMLPVMDGWAVLAELQTWTNAPSVIVVSAKNTPRDRVRATQLGAAAYVSKPFDMDDLIGVLSEVALARGKAQVGPIQRQSLDELPGLDGLEPA
ncbi:MAG: response regulator transcription factor [Actinomycetota bacterium]